MISVSDLGMHVEPSSLPHMCVVAVDVDFAVVVISSSAMLACTRAATHGHQCIAATVHKHGSMCKTNQLLADTPVAQCSMVWHDLHRLASIAGRHTKP